MFEKKIISTLIKDVLTDFNLLSESGGILKLYQYFIISSKTNQTEDLLVT